MNDDNPNASTGVIRCRHCGEPIELSGITFELSYGSQRSWRHVSQSAPGALCNEKGRMGAAPPDGQLYVDMARAGLHVSGPVDVTTVRPGQIEQMARAGAGPSAKFRAAIDRAVARKS